MNLLLILNREPYDGTDVVWNALRLAENSLIAGNKVRIFLLNNGVDLARVGLEPPGDSYDLQKMLIDLINKGVSVKLCKTCIVRCGLDEGETIEEAEIAGMRDLVEWTETSDKIISF
jgi:uncharacterized protein involved in oxidation of intracellular sulfur